MAQKKKSKKPKFTAKTADKHELYQHSVQDPEFEVAFISRVYRKLRGKKAMTLRGAGIAEEFQRIVDSYVDQNYEKRSS